MPKYRVPSLTGFYSAKEIPLDRAEGRRLERELDEKRIAYEEMLRKTFPYSYFNGFRITVFGSARTDENKTEFDFISKLTQKLGEKINVDIITGGGGGMMYAANYGLHLAIEKSKGTLTARNEGILVELPKGEGANAILDKQEKFTHFTTRLEEFVRRSNGIYLAPGGIGTGLEASLFMQLKQLGELEHIFPIVAHPFWKGIINYELNSMFKKRLQEGKVPLVSAQDLDLVTFTDDIDQIVGIFRKEHAEWEKLKKKVTYTDSDLVGNDYGQQSCPDGQARKASLTSSSPQKA